MEAESCLLGNLGLGLAGGLPRPPLYHRLRSPKAADVTHTLVPRGLCVCMFSGVQLFCDPMDCSPPGSSVHGISQARILAWVAISYSRGSCRPGIEPTSPALAVRFFTWESLQGVWSIPIM